MTGATGCDYATLPNAVPSCAGSHPDDSTCIWEILISVRRSNKKWGGPSLFQEKDWGRAALKSIPPAGLDCSPEMRVAFRSGLENETSH